MNVNTRQQVKKLTIQEINRMYLAYGKLNDMFNTFVHQIHVLTS